MSWKDSLYSNDLMSSNNHNDEVNNRSHVRQGDGYYIEVRNDGSISECVGGLMRSWQVGLVDGKLLSDDHVSRILDEHEESAKSAVENIKAAKRAEQEAELERQKKHEHMIESFKHRFSEAAITDGDAEYLLQLQKLFDFVGQAYDKEINHFQDLNNVSGSSYTNPVGKDTLYDMKSRIDNLLDSVENTSYQRGYNAGYSDGFGGDEYNCANENDDYQVGYQEGNSDGFYDS